MADNKGNIETGKNSAEISAAPSCPDSPMKPNGAQRRTAGAYIRATYNAAAYILGREFRYHRVKPIDALLFLTFRCTSQCKTCTLWQRRDAEGEMNLEEWKRVIDMCAEMGVRGCELFGGDALLRLDVLIPLIAYIKTKPGMEADLVTNCNLLTEEVAQKLVDAGIDDIWFSLDGVSSEHNRVRGRDDAFTRADRAIDGVLRARSNLARPLLHANTTISNLNYAHFDEVLPYAESKGLDFHHLEYAGEFWEELLNASVIDGIRPNPYFVRQGNLSILLNEEQARIVKDKVTRMKRDVRSMHISLQCENVDKLSIRQMVTGFCDNRRCYITRGKITVDPRGNILGCSFFGDWILGNVRQKPLREIWNNDRHRLFMRHFASRDMKICDHCIMGVQRNPTPAQNIRDFINRALGRARR